MGRPYRLRSPARQVRSPSCRIHLRGYDGRRCSSCDLCHFGRIRAVDIPYSRIHRMYAVRAWKRNSGSVGDQVYCQMVQGKKYGPCDGTPAFHCPFRYGDSYPCGSYDRTSESPWRSLYLGRDQPSCPDRTCCTGCRCHTVGRFCGHGCKI